MKTWHWVGLILLNIFAAGAAPHVTGSLLAAVPFWLLGFPLGWKAAESTGRQR